MKPAPEEIRRIARRIPRELRSLRGKLLLEHYASRLGVEEVTCPACGGEGRLGRKRRETCPVCRGFEEVPASLARWFEARLGRGFHAPAGPVWGRPRPGRLAEVSFRVRVGPGPVPGRRGA